MSASPMDNRPAVLSCSIRLWRAACAGSSCAKTLVNTNNPMAPPKTNGIMRCFQMVHDGMCMRSLLSYLHAKDPEAVCGQIAKHYAYTDSQLYSWGEPCAI